MEVPPPFSSLQACKPAEGRRGGENLAGGAWRGMEVWRDFWGKIFLGLLLFKEYIPFFS